MDLTPQPVNQPLSWNEFQSTHKGKWRQQEMRERYAEYKSTLPSQRKHKGKGTATRSANKTAPSGTHGLTPTAQHQHYRTLDTPQARDSGAGQHPTITITDGDTPQQQPGKASDQAAAGSTCTTAQHAMHGVPAHAPSTTQPTHQAATTVIYIDASSPGSPHRDTPQVTSPYTRPHKPHTIGHIDLSASPEPPAPSPPPDFRTTYQTPPRATLQPAQPPIVLITPETTPLAPGPSPTASMCTAQATLTPQSVTAWTPGGVSGAAIPPLPLAAASRPLAPHWGAGSALPLGSAQGGPEASAHGREAASAEGASRLKAWFDRLGGKAKVTGSNAPARSVGGGDIPRPPDPAAISLGHSPGAAAAAQHPDTAAPCSETGARIPGAKGGAVHKALGKLRRFFNGSKQRSTVNLLDTPTAGRDTITQAGHLGGIVQGSTTHPPRTPAPAAPSGDPAAPGETALGLAEGAGESAGAAGAWAAAAAASAWAAEAAVAAQAAARLAAAQEPTHPLLDATVGTPGFYPNGAFEHGSFASAGPALGSVSSDQGSPCAPLPLAPQSPQRLGGRPTGPIPHEPATPNPARSSHSSSSGSSPEMQLVGYRPPAAVVAAASQPDSPVPDALERCETLPKGFWPRRAGVAAATVVVDTPPCITLVSPDAAGGDSRDADSGFGPGAVGCGAPRRRDMDPFGADGAAAAAPAVVMGKAGEAPGGRAREMRGGAAGAEARGRPGAGPGRAVWTAAGAGADLQLEDDDEASWLKVAAGAVTPLRGALPTTSLTSTRGCPSTANTLEGLLNSKGPVRRRRRRLPGSPWPCGGPGMDPRVAQLPLYRPVLGCRMQPREALAHDHPELFAGFQAWIVVEPSKLRSARFVVPFKPGLYEWGAVAPGGSTVTAFYLGKAGTLRQPQLTPKRRTSGNESLRSRFNKYAVANRPIGPENELDKMALFVELQRRGFRMMYRYRVCEDEEPVTVETSLLRKINYALNLQNNDCRRAILIEGDKHLAAFPVLDVLAGRTMLAEP